MEAMTRAAGIRHQCLSGQRIPVHKAGPVTSSSSWVSIRGPKMSVFAAKRVFRDYSSTIVRKLEINGHSARRKPFEPCFALDGGVIATAAPLNPEEGGEEIPQDKKLSDKVVSFKNAFWKFLRPHTIRGTILGSFAVTAKALLENPMLIDWGLLPRALLGVLALLCGNGYIVGINQIYDVEIDAVNKPFLPVAAGELSKTKAWVICILLATAGVAITSANFGPLIAKLYTFGLFLGTIYSVPPLRLKRSAVAAFAIIATVRGFLLNFGVYHATRAALGLSFVWSPPIAFITAFVTIFATVIAITKDLPDVEGDRKFGIETFATRLGVRNIAFLGSGLLIANYAGAIALALRMPSAFNATVMIPFHALFAVMLTYKTLKLDAANYSKAGIQAYYQFIWNLFYAEYALLPFV